MKKSAKGFTLIELLVVIAIIGMLSAVILASLNSARLKARDAKRLADLHELRSALEMYYADNGTYPVVLTWAYSADPTWNTTGVLVTALAPYLSKLPVDPINNVNPPWAAGSYSYAYGCNSGNCMAAGKYNLVAQLEDPNNKATCQFMNWYWHQGGGETPWCGIYTPYLVADH